MFNTPLSVLIVEQIVFIYLVSSLACIAFFHFAGESVAEEVKNIIKEYENKSTKEVLQIIKKDLKYVVALSPLIVLIFVIKQVGYMLKISYQMMKNQKSN